MKQFVFCKKITQDISLPNDEFYNYTTKHGHGLRTPKLRLKVLK